MRWKCGRVSDDRWHVMLVIHDLGNTCTLTSNTDHKKVQCVLCELLHFLFTIMIMIGV